MVDIPPSLQKLDQFSLSLFTILAVFSNQIKKIWSVWLKLYLKVIGNPCSIFCLIHPGSTRMFKNRLLEIVTVCSVVVQTQVFSLMSPVFPRKGPNLLE